MENLKTAKEAAKYLRVSYTWMVNMLQQGKIRAYKAGGGWRIQQKDLDAYLQQHSNKRLIIK